LEQFDEVACGVVQQNLLSDRPADDVVAETQARHTGPRHTSAVMSSTMRWMRFQPPGTGVDPSAMGRAAELVGPDSSSRSGPS